MTENVNPDDTPSVPPVPPAERVQAEDLATLFRSVDNAIEYAQTTGQTHRSTDPTRRPGQRKVHMLVDTGDVLPALVTLYREESVNVAALAVADLPDRPRYGQANQRDLHIETSLNAANPNEITRVSLHWSGDHDPTAQAHSYSVARVIRRPEESGAGPETLPLADAERDAVFGQVMELVRPVLASTENLDAALAKRLPPAPQPDKLAEVKFGEANRAYKIITEFMSTQGLSAEGLSQDMPVDFLVGHIDEMMETDPQPRIRVRAVSLVQVLDDRPPVPHIPDGPGARAFVYLDHPEYGSLCVQIADHPQTSTPNAGFYVRNETTSSENSVGVEAPVPIYLPIALAERDRTLIFDAVRQQLLPERDQDIHIIRQGQA